jgi:hypothetical protein
MMSIWKIIMVSVLGCAADDDDGEPDDQWVNDGPVNVNGSCSVQPYTCADLGQTGSEQSIGCCFGSIVYWCQTVNDEWTLLSVDCETCAPENNGASIYCKSHVTNGQGEGGYHDWSEQSRW